MITEDAGRAVGKRVASGLQRPLLLDVVLAAFLFAVAFSVYLRTLAPTVAEMFSDTLELQLVAFQPGIAHPTGYPLFILLGKLFTFLPWGDVAYRVNLMSAFWGAATVAVVFLVIATLNDRSGRTVDWLLQLAGATGALYLAFSPIFWSQAILAEVYTLNTFLMVLNLWLALLFWRGRIGLVPSALAAGLGLTHHRTFVLFLAPIALFLWIVWRQRSATPAKRTVAKPGIALFVLFCAPLLLYAYLPLRGLAMSSLDGTYQNTLHGFLNWVSGSSYGVFITANPWHQTVSPIVVYKDALVAQFGPLGLSLACLGTIWLLWRERLAGGLLLLCYIFSTAFAVAYRVADVEPFYLPSFLAVAVSIGVGAAALVWAANWAFGRLAKRIPAAVSPVSWLPPIAISLVALYLPLAPVEARLPSLDLSQDREVRQYGEDVFSQRLDQGAAIVGLGGEITLFRYLQETEGLRKDLMLIREDDEQTRLARVGELLGSGTSVYLTRPLAGLAERYPLSSVGPLIEVRRQPLISSRPAPPASETAFADEAFLLGSSLVVSASPSDTLRVALDWRAGTPHGDRFVFIHVTNSEGDLVAQLDQRPVGGAYPTTYWRKGERFSDVYDVRLPAGTPPGNYQVSMGLYDAVSGQRVEAQPSGGPPTSALSLGAVRLEGSSEVPPTKAWGPLTWAGKGPESDGIHLAGAVWDQEAQVPGQVFALTTLWQTGQAPHASHRVQVSLLDSQRQPVAQDSFAPAGGDYPTSAWHQAELVRLQHQWLLPANLADGAYQLQVKMEGGRPVTIGTVLVQGRKRTFDRPAARNQIDATLGQIATLTGFDLFGDADEAISAPSITLRAGQNLRLVLYWRAEGSSDRAYKVFVHLVAPDGQTVAQHDAEPAGGEAPTTSWLQGEYIADEHSLSIPSSALAGQDTLIVGLYDPVSGERLRNSEGDFILLAKVTIQ